MFLDILLMALPIAALFLYFRYQDMKEKEIARKLRDAHGDQATLMAEMANIDMQIEDDRRLVEELKGHGVDLRNQVREIEDHLNSDL